MASAYSIRQKALAEWRGYREPRPVAAGLQSLDGVLGPAMLGLGLGERVQESEVLAAWKEIVGEFIAGHSVPSKLRAGILYVSVLQPSIHFELERVWKTQVLEKLKARFGKRVIREVRFRVG